MHINSLWCLNTKTGQETPYFRLKESYRDVRGMVHSLVMRHGVLDIFLPRAVRRADNFPYLCHASQLEAQKGHLPAPCECQV